MAEILIIADIIKFNKKRWFPAKYVICWDEM